MKLWRRKPSLRARVERLEREHMITQAQVDSLTALVKGDHTKLDEIQADVVALQAANPNVDMSALTAAINDLDTAATADATADAPPAQTPPATP